MPAMSAVRLQPRFDAERILADCRAMLAAAKGKPAGFAGEGHSGWEALTIYSHGSQHAQLLSRAPYIEHLLDELGLSTRLVRLMVLEPGGVIREHSDAFLSARIVRLHIPVVTHEDVEFYLDGKLCQWAAGELWYGDFSLPHHGVNRSPQTRLHLVIDANMDARLAELFPAGQPVPMAEASADEKDFLSDEALERLCFNFSLPPGFALPGMAPLDEGQAVSGTLRLIDSELRLFVNEQPMLKAVPLSEDRVELLGLGFPAELAYELEDGHARRVSLEAGGVAILTLEVER
jgi:aspartyl/asparaginyl beta-hydroxylase (cupin superfamily)